MKSIFQARIFLGSWAWVKLKTAFWSWKLFYWWVPWGLVAYGKFMVHMLEHQWATGSYGLCLGSWGTGWMENGAASSLKHPSWDTGKRAGTTTHRTLRLWRLVHQENPTSKVAKAVRRISKGLCSLYTYSPSHENSIFYQGSGYF